MTTESKEQMAALYALGALAPVEYEGVRRDREVVERAEAWEPMLAPLAATLVPLSPPPDLFARIEQRIDSRATSFTLGTGDGRWITVTPGLRVKILNTNPETRRQTILLDVDPGADYGAHSHDQDEEIYMISGDLQFGAISLSAGDYHLARAGSSHTRASTRGGCRCLVMRAI